MPRKGKTIPLFPENAARDRRLEKFAEKYEEKRDIRIAAQREELSAKAELDVEMSRYSSANNGARQYRHEDLIVEREMTEGKVKVRRADEEGEE